MFFLVITALIIWNHLCESCYVFFTVFFNKMSKHTILLRVGLLCCFDLTLFLVITGKNHILPKNGSLQFFPIMTRTFLCFWHTHIYYYLLLFAYNININKYIYMCVYVYVYIYNN